MNKTYKANKNHLFLKEGTLVYYSEALFRWNIRYNIHYSEFEQSVRNLYSPEQEPEWYDEERWKPEDGGKYFVVTACCEVSTMVFHGDRYDLNKLKTYNCYRTKEEAEAASERVLKAYKGE